MNNSLKSKVRHWFNFYRYALKSTDPDIVENLKKSKDFYKQWGDVGNISFDGWWKFHSHLFHQQQEIEILTGSIKTNDDSLYLKVPFTFAPTAASKYFARVYREEQDKKRNVKSKIKKQYGGSIELTPLEFQVVEFRYYSHFANKVFLPLYLKHNKRPATSAMTELALVKFKNLSNRSYEKSKFKSKGEHKLRVAPFSQVGNLTNLMDGRIDTHNRISRRYRAIVENLIRNASLGVFPGKYIEIGAENQQWKRKATSSDKHEVTTAKRIPRARGYEKPKKIFDHDNPNSRKLLVK